MARRRRYSNNRYRMTPARRAALRKAQIASAKKRKRSRNRKIAVGAGIAVVGVGGAAVARHRISGSSFSKTNHPIVGKVTGNVTGSRVASFSNSKLTGPGGRKAGRRISYHSKKSGPLGDSYSVSYDHKPVRIRNSKPRRTKTSGPVDIGPPTKTYGGVPIMDASEWTKKQTQTTMFTETMRVKTGWPRKTKTVPRIADAYVYQTRKNRKGRVVSGGSVHGQTVESYLKSLSKKYPKTWKA